MGSTNHPNCDSAVTPPANWPHPMPWASLPEPGGRGQPCPSVTKVQLAPSSPSLCLCRAFPSWPQAQDSCVPIALLGGAGRGQGGWWHRAQALRGFHAPPAGPRGWPLGPRSQQGRCDCPTCSCHLGSGDKQLHRRKGCGNGPCACEGLRPSLVHQPGGPEAHSCSGSGGPWGVSGGDQRRSQ